MRRQLATVIVVALCLVSGVTACSKEPGPGDALKAYFEGFRKANLDGVALEDDDGQSLGGAAVTEQIKTLTGDLLPGQAAMTLAGEPTVEDDFAAGNVGVDWTIAAGVVWHYENTIRLHKVDDAWRVIWSPMTVHRQLKADDVLRVQGIKSDRGQILDGAGQAIVKPRPVVIVGIEPRRVSNQAALLAALDGAFKSAGVAIDLADVPGRIAAAKPDAFVEVIVLRRDVYDTIRGRDPRP